MPDYGNPKVGDIGEVDSLSNEREVRGRKIICVLAGTIPKEYWRKFHSAWIFYGTQPRALSGDVDPENAYEEYKGARCWICYQSYMELQSNEFGEYSP